MRLVQATRSESQAQPNPLDTLVPEGEYVLSFVSEELGTNFGRTVWFVTLEIAEGEHQGKRVLRFYNAPRKGSFLARSTSLSQDFMEMTGLRPPSEGFKPSQLLHGVQVAARIVTVSDRPPNKRDKQSLDREKRKAPTRIKLPPAQHYSRVDSIHAVVGSQVDKG